MDFRVEATVHLNVFHDEGEVLEILRSHGFQTPYLGREEVRVSGWFSQLRAVKAQLEQLPKAQSGVPSPSHPPLSSGAIRKNHSSSDGNRSRSGSRNKAQPPQFRAAASPRPDQEASPRAEDRTVVVDRDVFMYADRLRKKDIASILRSCTVEVSVEDVGESSTITLKGRDAGRAAGELQSFLNRLTVSLRTQEVHRKDVDREGEALLWRIRENGNVHRSVLVCEKTNRLHLIGPSGESYELKQNLLGRPVDRTGRTVDSREHVRRQNAERGAIGAGGSPPNREGAEAERGASRRRSWKRADRDLQETENKDQKTKPSLFCFSSGCIIT